jgi:hypothetical protein
MGLSVNTQNTFKYVFEDKRDLPEDEQPYLVFRYLSARDVSKMERLFIETYTIEDADALIKKAAEAINVGLVDWHGFELPFNLADLDAILTQADFIELRLNLAAKMHVSQLEKKAYVSRSLSITAKSVANETASA